MSDVDAGCVIWGRRCHVRSRETQTHSPSSTGTSTPAPLAAEDLLGNIKDVHLLELGHAARWRSAWPRPLPSIAAMRRRSPANGEPEEPVYPR